MSSFISFDGPNRLLFDASLPDIQLPRMEIRLKKDLLYYDSDIDPLDTGTACLLVGEYLETLGNERIVSINCAGGKALNYCVAAEGSDRGVELNTAANNMLKAALLSGADSVFLVHNHPQGKALPSQTDLNGICYLQYLFTLIDIKIHDMYIVGGTGEMFSCKEHYPEFFKVNEKNYEALLPNTKIIED